MKKIGVVILVLLMAVTALYPLAGASDAGCVVDQELVTISIASGGLSVDETVRVTNNGPSNATSVRFWLQQNAKDTSIVEKQSGKSLVYTFSENEMICNLSALNLTMTQGASLDFELSYTLPTTEQYYIKTLLYDTISLSVIYKEGNTERDLFQGQHLLYGADVSNALQIRLYKPTEAPLDITMIMLIFAVVIIIFAVLLLLLRRQRSQSKKAVVESEETLSTKKSLLLSLLKDLEKQYRAQSISDETYNKLKEEYKSQAVDAMKKLDDLKK
jgi:hypothetical protein